MPIQQEEKEQLIDPAIALLRDFYDRLRLPCANELESRLSISPALDADEAKFFVLGIEAAFSQLTTRAMRNPSRFPVPQRAKAIAEFSSSFGIVREPVFYSGREQSPPPIWHYPGLKTAIMIGGCDF